MPQTEEHLAICDLLGIRRGLVVLTKADLVSEEQLGVVCEEVRAALQPSFLKEAQIVPVSAHSGFGMAALAPRFPACGADARSAAIRACRVCHSTELSSSRGLAPWSLELCIPGA